mmetsp:Transcript_2622/g.10215  ORF Transcript_2622/g.10215 Transcript_2622/m.10215 type:complete len:96 (+) Transcript_2622:101-388(+)
MFRTKSLKSPVAVRLRGRTPARQSHPPGAVSRCDRERVYGAGITGDARVVHPRAVLLAKSHFPRLKVTHLFATASHAARTSSGGAATPKSFSKCS